MDVAAERGSQGDEWGEYDCVVLFVFWVVRAGMRTGWSCRRWMVRIEEFGAGNTSLVRQSNRKGAWKLTVGVWPGLLLGRVLSAMRVSEDRKSAYSCRIELGGGVWDKYPHQPCAVPPAGRYHMGK